MGSGALVQSLPVLAEPEPPVATHRWNFGVISGEAAVYMAASDMMGPLTLIPFLFAKTGIDNAWIGLFTLAGLLSALGNPIGSALAGGLRWKLPFCVRVGLIQRLPLLAVPLGVTFFFDQPEFLLSLLVVSWVVSSLLGGVAGPIYQFVITNGTWESWWGRLMGLRNLLGALTGLGATVFVWWVNRVFAAPHNYQVIGWLGAGMLGLSLFLVSRIREVPVREDQSRGPERVAATLRHMGVILHRDAVLRWLVLAHVLRSCGFLMGAYMTAVLVQRLQLQDKDMWIPVLMNALPSIAAHIFSGWLVDRWGAKPAIVLSSLLVAANSLFMIHCYSMAAFILLFISGTLGGSLLANAWPTLLTKLAPRELRPAYFSAISLGTAPGNILVMVLGILLVRATGYDYVFYVSALGSLISAWLFYTKLPNIRYAPVS